MRAETLSLFYKANKFIASMNGRDSIRAYRSYIRQDRIGSERGDSVRILIEWLRCIGSTNVESIGNLVLAEEERDFLMGTIWTRQDLEAVEGVSLPSNISSDYISNEAFNTWREGDRE